MTDRDPLLPPPPGGYIPPPPPDYQGAADIPPQSPYHYNSAPANRRNRGVMGGLVAALAGAFAYGKYALLLLFKIPAAGTLISLVVSFGGYALFYGPWFAVALVTMILVHEMGHVVEIRRQGMHATAPIFIPFILPIPMSAIVRMGNGSIGGTVAVMPVFGARVPRAKPLRSSDCAKMVYAASSAGCTITS